MATSFTTHSAGQVIASADINLIQTAVNALENAPAGTPAGVFLSADLGYLGWSFDPAMTSSNVAMAGGVAKATTVRLPAGTVTNLYTYITTTGTPTGAYMALYTSAGVFVAQSTNSSGSFGTAGLKVFALTAPTAVAAGLYYLIHWQTGTQASPLAVNPTPVDAKVGSAVIRSGTAGSALTTTAPSPLGTVTATAAVPWYAAA